MSRLPTVRRINRAYTRERAQERLEAAREAAAERKGGCEAKELDAAIRALRASEALKPGRMIVKERK